MKCCAQNFSSEFIRKSVGTDTKGVCCQVAGTLVESARLAYFLLAGSASMHLAWRAALPGMNAPSYPSRPCAVVLDDLLSGQLRLLDGWLVLVHGYRCRMGRYRWWWRRCRSHIRPTAPILWWNISHGGVGGRADSTYVFFRKATWIQVYGSVNSIRMLV